MFNLTPRKGSILNFIIMLPIIASSLISGLFGVAQQKQMLNAQQQENEQSFQRNMQLAQQQNAMNVAQWNRENEYNLPLNQIKRLKEAGLSPALMYKNGTSGLTAATSPSMSGGTPYNPVDMTMSGNRKTIGDVVQNTINNSLLSAQTELVKAQADKTRSETVGINISNDVNEQLLMAKTEAEIKQILSSTNLNDKQIELVAANIDKFKKECEVFDATIKEKFANINNITYSQFMQILEYDLNKQLNNATIKKLVSDTQFNETQIKRIAKELPFVLRKYIAEIKSIDTNTANAEVQRNLIFEQICTEVIRRADIQADISKTEAVTEGQQIANVISGDKAQRYDKLWGPFKDILYIAELIFGSDAFSNISGAYTDTLKAVPD